jgi:hypothetical protein
MRRIEAGRGRKGGDVCREEKVEVPLGGVSRRSEQGKGLRTGGAAQRAQLPAAWDGGGQGRS